MSLWLTDSGEIRKVNVTERKPSMYKVIQRPLSCLKVFNGQLYKQAETVVVPVIKRIAGSYFALMRAMGRLNWSLRKIRDNLYQNEWNLKASLMWKILSPFMRAEKKIASYEDGLAIYQTKIISDW